MRIFGFNEIANAFKLLQEDLKRQFALRGYPEKKIGVLAVLKAAAHPQFLPLIFCRFSRAAYIIGIPVLPFVFSYLNLFFFGLQVTPRCEIGGGFFLPHPVGTVVGAWRIGRNVTLFHQVTLGAKELDMAFTPNLLPEICDNITIGAGAKVLGGIRLGDFVIVGANAVVVRSIEPNSTVVGIPARNINLSISSER